MVEPYLMHTNGNSTSTEISKCFQSNAQTAQPWQNEYLFPTTEQNPNNHQLHQFIREVRPGPSRLAHTADLNKSNSDLNDEFYGYLSENVLDAQSMNNNAVNSLLNRHAAHTMTTGQLELDNNVALPDLISQRLPQITEANFEIENAVNTFGNGGNTLDEAAGWMKEANVLNHIFDYGLTKQLPNPLVAKAPATSTTTTNDLKWEDIFGVMKHQLIPDVQETNDPLPSTSTNTSRFQLPLINDSTTNINPLAQKVPETKPNLIGPFLPQMNEANAAIIDQPPGITYQPKQQMIDMGPAFHNGQILAPNPPLNVNNLFRAQNQIATLMDKNIQRTPTGLIPIKVVRSTQQYETLLEMGFLKKDIETALRKCNLDLCETIEYLSEPKRAAKRRKKDVQQNDHLAPYQFHDQFPIAIQHPQLYEEPNIQHLLYEQPNKVEAEPTKKPANLYEELLQLEESGGIVKSIESFDCEICMETIEMKDGMILRNCLHRYCKDCLNGTIVHSDDITIKCPYVSCEEIIQDREMRAVLSPDDYEKYLMRGVRVAQVTISGTVLCNLPDCDGWCICEDVVNEFKCPQCKNINCIPCKAIHPERNCREYQDDLAAGDANGIISGQRRSEQAMQDLINRNEAMKCFKCGILIMKRDGCDYIECVMCKAGICWATRGPRYGPGGVGDLSGGCHCSVQKRCHKDCRGCH